nr:MAG TPA: hypothetical protein [Caudoviricetes sp.]
MLCQYYFAKKFCFLCYNYRYDYNNIVIAKLILL